MSGLEYATLRDQIAALRAKRISASELLDLAIRRIETFDGKINAVAVRDFERAREAAKSADAALARGDRGALLGVPMTVKESFNVGGLPTTWGFPAGKDWRPPDDAVLVSRAKAAGAVIAGKTNVPLALADWQSYNDIYGTTNNPWDLGRTPGGSSGGAAAALAAGYVALELGSDIGGSVRVPAHYCGVFAHKPSYGLLPLRGHAPPHAPALPSTVDLAVVGPMARSAADLSLAIDVLAGPDDEDALAYTLKLPAPRANALKDFRVLVIDSHPLVGTAASVRSALDRTAQALEKLGARVSRDSALVPDLTLTSRTYMTLLMSIFGADIPLEAYKGIESTASTIPAHIDTMDAVRARGLVASHRDWILADRVRTGLRAGWRKLFGEFDVVLCPVMPTPAYPHDHSPDQRRRTIDIDGIASSYQDQILWPGIATVIGLPATAMPIGPSPEGLPIGMQVIGPWLEDRTALRFAELAEQEFGGFKPPPGFA
ncbi:amidase [Afipia sp. TerB]